MFLIRATLLFAAVVMLMPSDAAQQARLASSAGAAVSRAATFCDRNAQTCATASQAWASFTRKAEFAVELGLGLARDYMSQTATGARAGEPKRSAEIAAAVPAAEVSRAGGKGSRGTLSAADQTLPWRGAMQRTGY